MNMFSEVVDIIPEFSEFKTHALEENIQRVMEKNAKVVPYAMLIIELFDLHDAANIETNRFM